MVWVNIKLSISNISVMIMQFNDIDLLVDIPSH